MISNAFRLKNLSNESKATICFLISGVIQKGIQMLVTPIYTRLMSTQEFGMYSTYNAWYQIIYIFITLRIATGVYTQGLVKFDKDKDRFQSSMLGLSITIITLSSVLLFINMEFWIGVTGLSTVLLYAILTDSMADTIFQLWQRRELYEVRWKTLIYISVLNSILTSAIGIYAVLHFRLKVEARVLSSVTINVLLFTPLLVKQFRNNRTFYNYNYWKYAILYSLPLIPHYLSQVVLNQADRIMIASISGTDKAGIYSLAYSLALVMQIVNDAINKTLDPWLFRQIKNKNYKDISKISYQLMVVVGGINLLLIILAPEIVYIFAPMEYFEAIWVIPPVSSSVYFIFMYNFFVDFEFYYEKTRWISIASIAGALLNIILNYFMIPQYGFLAAGYTTLVCYLIYVIAHFVFMSIICKNELGNIHVYNAKIILIISFSFMFIAAFFTMLYKHILARYIIVTTIFIILIFCHKKIINYYKIFKGELKR